MQDHVYVTSSPIFLFVFLQLLHRVEPMIDILVWLVIHACALLPLFWPCFCNYYMGTNTRYTCGTANPCLCNSHISVCVSATTTSRVTNDILVWLVIHAYATPHISVCVSATTTSQGTNDSILVWLVIHACATSTFLTVFVQLLHGKQWEFIQDTLVCHLCDF